MFFPEKMNKIPEIYLDKPQFDDYRFSLNKPQQGRYFPMKVKPLHDQIIVRRVEEEEKTKGGIIIPDTAKEKPAEGVVVAVGAGRAKKDGSKIPMEVKVKDRVLFARYAGTEVKIEGEEHLMMKEDDVLAVIEK
jgi:chaperonin GroES